MASVCVVAVPLPKESAQTLFRISSQVAHDIRSPLAALSVIEKELGSLPEETRLILRGAVNRIRDIANNLLEKNREIHNASKSNIPSLSAPVKPSSEPASCQLLFSLVDPLMTEKRLQFRSKMGIEIDGRIDAESYGLFTKVQPTEFKRVLSNLINNSAEALGEKGVVTVSLRAADSKIEIRVCDNGQGIPPEILKKLGQAGETHGKKGGSGLGLYHARLSLESWGGKLEIQSELGKGTSVILTLPCEKPPVWFLPELRVSSLSVVVVLDDDTSIHQIWNGRLDPFVVNEKEIRVFHFSIPNELRDWVQGERSRHSCPVLYLIDYEFLGYKETGLSLIEELNLSSESFLVTSRFEEKKILEDCERLKLRLIPKGMAGFVPIRVEEPVQTESFDAVLIDDDTLVHMTWAGVARSLNKKLRLFLHPDEFFDFASRLSKATPIYVDANLSDGIRGEEISKRIAELGFKEVYLATGYDAAQYSGLSYLRGVCGKSPPWVEDNFG